MQTIPIPGGSLTVSHPPGSTDDTDQLTIEPLGSGQEVGRSCVLLTYRGRKVMFDCGVHPGKSGLDSLPEFPDKCDEIDLVLITHFHLDHCAGLPYLCEQTEFKGRVFMTNSTKAFYKICMKDFITVGTSAQDVATMDWLDSAMKKIETIDFKEEKVHNGICVQPFVAGHVLGAAMFMVDIAGVKILYTGDFSMSPDRHLGGAEVPPISPDVLIVESTYGTIELERREDREEKFLQWTRDVVLGGGRCLVPVFALGRAQELLLILEEEWERDPDLQHVPIYYASSMAEKSMKQYQTFVSDMNQLIKDKHAKNINPFDFKYIKPLKNAKSFNDEGPCVVLASPGMLQSGVSYDLFTRWCGNSRNGIIIAGYCVEGTLAKEVLEKPQMVTAADGRNLPLKMGTIESVSFSAHSDGRQTKEFISSLKNTLHVVLVHGQPKPMSLLKESILSTQEFIKRGIKAYNPRNREKVIIPFSSQRVAKVLGSLAETVPLEGESIHGLMLLSEQHKYTIVHPKDLSTFTGLQAAEIHQAMVLPLPVHRSADEILTIFKSYFAQSRMFADVVPTPDNTPAAAGSIKSGDDNTSNEAAASVSQIAVARSVVATVAHDPHTSHTTVTIKWTASTYDDLLADVSTISLIKGLGEDFNDEEEGSILVKQHRGEDLSLPVELPISDNLFRHKCFHQLMSHLFPAVTTDLKTCEATIHLSLMNSSEVVKVRNYTQIVVPEGSKPNPIDLQRLADALKRTYLTLFPMPVSDSWCECGKIHYEDLVGKSF